MHPLKAFFRNARKPVGLAGRFMLWGMNCAHAPLAAWGRSHLSPAPDARILDIGCGGGANLAAFLELCPVSLVYGLDFSEESVLHSREKNAAAIKAGRCEVTQGDVSAMPYENDRFDIITAFETVYFWPDLSQTFREVRRVLKPSGTFLICNDECNPQSRWLSLVEGMTVYDEPALRALLCGAGFTVASDAKGGRLCLMAQKNG